MKYEVWAWYDERPGRLLYETGELKNAADQVLKLNESLQKLYPHYVGKITYKMKLVE